MDKLHPHVQYHHHPHPHLQRLVLGFFWLLFLPPLLILAGVKLQVQGQQTYVNNRQLACYNQSSNFTTLGYLCNGLRPSCQSYLTFRSAPPYNSPVYIAYLLAAHDSATLIASINNFSSDLSTIPTGSLVVVPVNCSCFDRRYYQHNATYKLKSPSETYFTVANNTYQGLTTCQALMDQNPFSDRHLYVNQTLQVPLRCACPTSNQTSSALRVKYLLTYMVTWGDSISSIAQRFGVDEQAVLDANELSSQSIIFPFTPILVPLATEPTNVALQPPPGAPPPQTPTQTPVRPVGGSDSSSNKKKWVYVGVGVGIGVLLLLALVGFVVFLVLRRRNQFLGKVEPPVSSTSEAKKLQSESESGYTEYSKSWALAHDIRHAVEALTVYKFQDLQLATNHFSQVNKIKGSVYRGSFKGDAAAVKVMKGDVSASPEINILRKISHSNIIRLSGFCVHDGNTYLVYEYAENGSLSDWLLGSKTKLQPCFSLTWKQRVQIAYDVADALNYLHNYTDPPYIHKNLKTSNILLDGSLRAKVANFGLARTVMGENDNGEGDGDGALQLTRHVVGTKGYMAPEYVENGLITPKLDVFAFGVVILELLSGKEAAPSGGDGDGRRDELLFTLINRVLEGDNVREKLRGFIDPSLTDEYPLDLAFSMAQLAKGCVAQDLNSRPSVPQVFTTLSKILSSSLDWDPSHELQRSSASGSEALNVR